MKAVKMNERTVLRIMYAFIGLLIFGVIIAVVAIDNRDNAASHTSSRSTTAPAPRESSASPPDTSEPIETPAETTASADASEPPVTTVEATTEMLTTALVTTAAPTEPETTADPGPSIPLSIYVHEPKATVWTKAAVYTSRWPANDDEVGRESNGNYKAWVTGYWTRDWWSFSGVTHLICDTTYFFVIPSDADTVKFSTSYGTNTWAKEWAAMWKDAGLDGAKIGYKVERVMKDGTTHSMIIKDPSHTFEEQPYYENYLYDEVHRPNASHVTTGAVTKDTILTDIKITLRNGCYDIDHFVLTAFVYTSDADFDASGEYTGRISAECIIKAN